MSKIKPCQAIVKHLFKSIQEGNLANEYLLQSLKMAKVPSQKTLAPSTIITEDDIRLLNHRVKTRFKNVSDYFCFSLYQFAELIEKDIDYRHVISLITADEIEHYFLCSPIDIISSRYEGVPYEKTISEVRDAMTLCSVSDGYRRPYNEEIVKAVNCTNIYQMCGIDARSIPPEIARWSNLVWFQCPWTNEYPIHDLIRGFLGSAADNCAPGTFVCVGITTHPRYMHKYNLEHILHSTLDYEFLGVDDVLINELLLYYGYKHECNKPKQYDIHHRIEESHVTLVFRLRLIIVWQNYNILV